MLSSFNHSGPGPQLAHDLFAAIGRRAWAEVEELASAEITVEVHGAPGIRTRRNEHLWREVSLRGRPALREYLLELNLAMPALSVQPRATASDGDAERQVVRADCAGVDNAGSAFDAETDFTLWTDGQQVTRLVARVNELAVGGDVIRRTEGDPRKYFENFLSDA